MEIIDDSARSDDLEEALIFGLRAVSGEGHGVTAPIQLAVKGAERLETLRTVGGTAAKEQIVVNVARSDRPEIEICCECVIAAQIVIDRRELAVVVDEHIGRQRA